MFGEKIYLINQENLQETTD